MHHRPWAMIVMLAFEMPAWAAEDGYPVTLPADKYIRPTDVTVVGGIVRLVRPVQADGQGAVTLEAEAADSLSLQDRGRLIGLDPEASGGGYIHFVSRAEYHFALDRPAVLKTWYRVLFPFTAHWNHSETMDGQSEHVVIDSAGTQPADRWLWLPGPVYTLAAGPHVLRLNNYHGGARLDKIVLLPPDQPAPSGQGPRPAWTRAPATGQVETTGLVPRDIRRWDRFTAHLVPAGGEIEVWYSRDLGRSWHPLPKDGDLRSVTVDPEGYNGLKLRYVLKAGPEGFSPLLQEPCLRYIGPEPTVLTNGRLRLEFAPSGELLALRDLVRGRDLTVAGLRVPLLAVTFLHNGQLTDLVAAGAASQRLEMADGRPGLVQSYDLAGRASAEVKILLVEDRLTRWTAAIVNRDPQATIVHVDFPRLEGVRLGDRGDDDWLCLSQVNGNLFKNPAQCPSLINTSHNFMRAHAFDFIALWDERGGLYFASHDPAFRDTGLPVSKTDETSVGLCVRKWTRIRPGQTWQSPEAILMAHDGDWHVGADCYRAWLEKHVRPWTEPRWVREEFDAWDVRTANYFTFYGFHGLVKNFEKNRPYGITDIMANRQGFDTNVGYCGLCPAPSPTWGGEELLAQANQMVRERGGHTYFYINWDLWNGRYAQTPRIGRNARTLYPPDALLPDYAWYQRNAIRRPDGSVILGDPAAAYEEHPLCNAATDVQQFHAYWAERYARRYNATGIYWDCLNNGYDPCYAFDHGHDDLGQWARGSHRALAACREAARSVEPHYMQSGEGLAPVLTAEHNHVYIANHNFNYYELARYTVPWLVLVGGPWDAYSPKPEELINWTNYQFLGAVRYMGLPWTDYGRRTMHLRRAVKQWLYPAVYRDVVGLSLVLPAGFENPPPAPPVAPPDQRFVTSQAIAPQGMGFQAKHLRLQRPGTAVTLLCLVNTTGKTDGAVRLDKSECPAVRAAWLVDWDGRWSRLDVRDEGRAWRVPVATPHQSHAILVDRAEPLLEVEADAYATYGETLPVTVRVRNLNPHPLSARLQIASSDGLTAAPAAFDALPPGAETRQVLPVKMPAHGPDRRLEFEVVASTPEATARRLTWVWLGPPVRLGIDEKLDGTGLIVHLENKSSRPVTGSCRAKPVAGLTVPESPIPFALAPGRSQDLDLPIALRPELQLPTLARVEVTLAEQKRELVYLLQPPVVNGDFEIDLAGDGQPDYWTVYTPQGIARYDQAGLDAEVKHTGRYSFWLAPPASTPGRARPATLAYGLHLRAIPDRRYRVRAAIRREQPGPAVVLVNGQALGPNQQTGQWEVFETVVTTTRPMWDTDREMFAALTIMLHNQSTGRAWFDSITAELLPP